MTYKISDVITVLEDLAPLSLAEDWDNCGLLIGSAEQAVSSIVIALDADDAAIALALETQAELLIVHHPPIFSGIKHLNEAVPEMRNFAKLIRAGINVYAAHTNMDAAVGGVNDCLAEVIGLKVHYTLYPSIDQGGRFANENLRAGLVRIAELDDALPFKDFLQRVNQHLQTPGCFMSGLTDKSIKRVALSGGAYDENWTEDIVAAGVDCLISGEIKHHQLIGLEARGVRALAAGHDCTERPLLHPLAAYLEAELPGIIAQAYTGLDYNQLF